MTVRPLRLESTYLLVNPDETVTPIPVSPDFWATIGQRTDIHDGRMVMRFFYDADWTTWEVHPHADEVIICVGGTFTMVLDLPEGERRVELSEGETVVIPAGIWHTADVPGEASGIFLTAGRGTQHRPR